MNVEEKWPGWALKMRLWPNAIDFLRSETSSGFVLTRRVFSCWNALDAHTGSLVYARRGTKCGIFAYGVSAFFGQHGQRGMCCPRFAYDFGRLTMWRTWIADHVFLVVLKSQKT